MALQILNQREQENPLSNLAPALGNYFKVKQGQRERQELDAATQNFIGGNPEQKQNALAILARNPDNLKALLSYQEMKQKQDLIDSIENAGEGQQNNVLNGLDVNSGNQQPQGAGMQTNMSGEAQQAPLGQKPFWSGLSDKRRMEITLANPTLAKSLEDQSDNYFRQQSDLQKLDIDREKLKLKQSAEERAQKEHDRKFGVEEREFAMKQAEKEVSPIRDTVSSIRADLPNRKKTNSIIKEVVANGKAGPLSRNNLAEATGIELFKTAEGAAFDNAMKNQVVEAFRGVAPKGLTLFAEKLVNNAFQKYGQTPSAQMGIALSVDAGSAIDDYRVALWDELSNRDINEVGYVKASTGKEYTEKLEDVSGRIVERLIDDLQALEKGDWSKIGKETFPLKNKSGKTVDAPVYDGNVRIRDKKSGKVYFVPLNEAQSILNDDGELE